MFHNYLHAMFLCRTTAIFSRQLIATERQKDIFAMLLSLDTRKIMHELLNTVKILHSLASTITEFHFDFWPLHDSIFVYIEFIFFSHRIQIVTIPALWFTVSPIITRPQRRLEGRLKCRGTPDSICTKTKKKQVWTLLG